MEVPCFMDGWGFEQGCPQNRVVFEGAVPERGVFWARVEVLMRRAWRWRGVKEYESWLLGPGLDLILFIVQLGATGPPRYTLVLQIYNYITNFQLMCFCYMLFVGKMMPVLLSIRCFNDGDWVYRSLVAE